MPITSRLYVFEESGAVKRVPKRIQDALVFGDDAPCQAKPVVVR
jgi:hypothetical protein